MTRNQILKHFGSGAAVGRALGISRQAVDQWRHFGVPLKTQFKIERKTKGKLKVNLSTMLR